MLLLSLLAFNEDNVLTSDISEPNEWDQGHPASRSTYTTMLLLLSLLAFNDDNVLASDVPEPNGWGQDRHVSRSTYNTMLLLQQTYGPSGCYQVQTSRSTSREYDVLASDVWWQNLLLSKFKVKTICIDVTEVIIVPWLRGEALQGHKQPISSNQTINY